MANADIVTSATTRLTRLRVEQVGSERHLKFERDTDAIQSAIDMDNPQKLIMENLRYLLGVLLFIPRPQKILLLGLGGGALVHFLRHHLPDAQITAVEYDAEVLEIAKQHLALPPADESLHYVIDDARRFIEIEPQGYDLILIDIFDGGESPPWMLQKTFIQALKRQLSDRGALGFNLLLAKEKSFSRFYQLLRSEFAQQTLCLETEEYANILVYAMNFPSRPLSMNELLQRCEELDALYDLPLRKILNTVFNINPQGAGVI
jgi:spermidine synthase